MVWLLDVNVLIALVTPSHPHFPLASDWFARVGVVEGWATCALTELGAIRICALIPPQRSPEQTADALLKLQREHATRYFWWPEAPPPEVVSEVREAQASDEVSDRYLLGLARRHRGRLVTFDRDLAADGGETVFCLTPAPKQGSRPAELSARDNGSKLVM